MRRILLTGITGQVGQQLQRILVNYGEVTGVGRETFDLVKPDACRQIIETVRPNLIVNAAAYTAVDRAESEFELAKSINAVAPMLLAEAAQRVGATFVHISTDYVFDGRKGSPYTELDAVSPINAYGQSKLVGEENVRQVCDRHIILRTAWVYGAHGRNNFVKTMLRLGAERDEIRVVSDQVGTPTWTGDLAQTITQLSLKFTPAIAGTYHFTNSGVASWYDFAIAIFEEARQLGFPLKVERVVPITTPEYPTPAQRPAYSVLACQKVSTVLGTHPTHWRQGLRQMLGELYNSYESDYPQRR